MVTTNTQCWPCSLRILRFGVAAVEDAGEDPFRVSQAAVVPARNPLEQPSGPESVSSSPSAVIKERTYMSSQDCSRACQHGKRVQRARASNFTNAWVGFEPTAEGDGQQSTIQNSVVGSPVRSVQLIQRSVRRVTRDGHGPVFFCS